MDDPPSSQAQLAYWLHLSSTQYLLFILITFWYVVLLNSWAAQHKEWERFSFLSYTNSFPHFLHPPSTQGLLKEQIHMNETTSAQIDTLIVDF